MLIMTELIGYGISINVRRFVISVAMLAVSITLTAQLKPSEQERQMVQRLQEAQMNGSDSDYYKAQEAFMDYLEKNSEWDKYYRTWMGRVIYEVNHKRFHRAFGEINFITDDIKQRHHEQYAYIANMCLGFFYNGRNQQDMAEKCFRRALQGIDVQKDPISVFNVYLSLSQTLSFNRPAEAMGYTIKLDTSYTEGARFVVSGI